MKCIIFCIWILALFVPVNIYPQKVFLTEIKGNTQSKDYKRILIIGYGPLEARIFLDALTDALIKDLANHHLEAQYAYEGVDTLTRLSQIKPFSINNFDAIMVFFPTDSSHNFDIHYKKRSNYIPNFFPNYVGTPQYRTYRQSVLFAETFGIQLYESNHQDITIWAANLRVNGDFTKSNEVLTISKMVLANLTKNKILP